MTDMNSSRLSRRALLSGAAALIAGAAVAAPQNTLRPVARPGPAAVVAASVPEGARPVARKSAVDLIRAAGLEGQVGFVIADHDTGEVLERVDAAEGRPPASVTKALTSLYALEVLGPDYRFATRLLGTGPVTDGVLDGDLVLAGGGDPNLVTDELAILAERLATAGVKEVTGDLLVWANALPGVKEIEPGQLDQLGYNPSLGGLNLNYNRVFFEWALTGADYKVTMDARSETRRPAVASARMTVVDRSTPVYTYSEGSNVDEWTVSRRALGKAGSRWLPVRFPGLYAGEVFHTLLQEAGIKVSAPKPVETLPEGRELARFESKPLREMMQDMLLYSTNLTAEAVGMTATASLQGKALTMRESAAEMALWFNERAGISPKLVDHSGLSDENSVSASDMVKLLGTAEVAETLQPIMKSIRMVDNQRRAIKNFPGQVRAKTGTLNFVSTLAGYLETNSGRRLNFSIFAYDPDARDASLSSLDEQPAGAAGFNGRAKGLQQDILQRWTMLGQIGG